MAHEFQPVTVAVRAYATNVVPEATSEAATREEATSPKKKRRRTERRDPHRHLVLDTETTTDASQRLLFGVWRLFIDRYDELPGGHCVQEGFVYADELPTADPVGYGLLVAYAQSHRAATAPGRSKSLLLLSRTEFADKVLRPHLRDRGTTVTAFNLPFDLTRLALDVTPTRRRSKRGISLYGGFSIRLADVERFVPRIAYKPLDSKRALFAVRNPWSGRATKK